MPMLLTRASPWWCEFRGFCVYLRTKIASGIGAGAQAAKSVLQGVNDVVRKLVLSGLALLIVAVALVVAGRAAATAPTFEVSPPTYIDGVPTTFTVACHALLPGELDASVDIDKYDIYAGMSDEDLYAFAEGNDIVVGPELTTEQLEAREAYFTTVRENTTYYCDQLRHNREVGLLMTFGISLLLLSLLGIAAAVVAPRPPAAIMEKK